MYGIGNDTLFALFGSKILSKISLTSWSQQKPLLPLELQRFIRMRYDDLNPETLYKLALLILFGADFDRNKNCFSEVS